MKKIYIYENNRQTMKKRVFRLIYIGHNTHFNNLDDVVNYINKLDDENYFYTWEIK